MACSLVSSDLIRYPATDKSRLSFVIKVYIFNGFKIVGTGLLQSDIIRWSLLSVIPQSTMCLWYEFLLCLADIVNLLFVSEVNIGVLQCG